MGAETTGAGAEPSPGSEARRTMFRWGALAALWFIGVCLIPDPRPLGAPEWAGALRAHGRVTANLDACT